MKEVKVKIGEQVYCVRSDKTYGIKNHQIYKVVDVSSKYIFIETGIGKIGFKPTTSYFLDMTSSENLKKIRKLKLDRVFKN